MSSYELNPPKQKGVNLEGLGGWIHSNAGSRTDFWGKNRAMFSGELFSGEEFLPRTAFSGKKFHSILSNQVISWNGSRADRCPLGREFSAKRVLSLQVFFFRFKSKLSWGKEKHPNAGGGFMNPLHKRPWKRFSTNVLIRGKWIHSTAN